VAFQKVGNEAKFSFVRIFPANSRTLRGQSLGVARMRVCCSGDRSGSDCTGGCTVSHSSE
jgi:hypothetical protein